MKNRKLSIRISDNDWKQAHDQAERAGLSLTEYVTACCVGKRIVVIDGLDEVIHQQKAIGRNLNQLTTLANMGAGTETAGWSICAEAICTTERRSAHPTASGNPSWTPGYSST